MPGIIKIADVFRLLDPAIFGFFTVCTVMLFVCSLFFAYVFKTRQTKSAVTSASFVYFCICKRKAFLELLILK